VTTDRRATIWIDLSTAPDPLFFRPIVGRLAAAGHDAWLTARSYGETVAIASQCGLTFDVVGRHGGGSLRGKAAAVVSRAVALAARAKGRRPDVALSFNSYAQALAARALGIPFVTVMDYEYQPANHLAFRLARRVIVPEGFDRRALRRQGARDDRVFVHPGLKEHVTLADFRPDPGFTDQLRALGVCPTDVLVTVRPPPTRSTYYRLSDTFFLDVVVELTRRPGVKVIVLPRYESQAEAVRSLSLTNVVLPTEVLDGLNLVHSSDLVVSAGGSMNREAVVLGTPAWTMFRGRMAGVDARLIAAGRLVHVRSIADVAALPVGKKPPALGPTPLPEALDSVAAAVLGVL
jgi:predicted glycosyltransferase